MADDFLYKHIVLDLEDFIKNNDHSKSGKEYILDCPECLSHGLNGRGKLYITNDYKIGFCQRCKSVFKNKLKDVNEELLDDLKTPTFRFNDNSFSIDKVDVDFYNYSSEYMEDEVKYLIHRNPALKDLYKDLGFKFRKSKVIMPFYWDNEVFYYQVRSTLNRDESPLPYFCPVTDHKPIWINPLNKGSNTVVLVEGIFGAIGAWLTYKKNYDVISVQGSYITKYQLWMMSHFNYNKYLLYFDEVSISKHIRDSLVEHNPIVYCNTEIIESKFHDPEDDYLNRTIEH